MSSISESSSAGLADEGVNVTFINGLPQVLPSLLQNSVVVILQISSRDCPPALHSVDTIYYTVTSSTSNPGNYVISLDFSKLGITDAEWNDAVVLKRSNSSSDWTTLLPMSSIEKPMD